MSRQKIRQFYEENPEVVKLGDEIFGLVQEAQGRGFVSDGVSSLDTTKQLFGVIRGHLKYTRQAARLMEKWLRKHGEL